MEPKLIYSHAAVLAVGIMAGVIAGREYFRYEVRQTFQAAAESLGKGLNVPAANTSPSRSTSAPPPQSKSALESSPVLIRLTKKGFTPEDFEAGRPNDTVTFVLMITNNSNKDIRAFDGVVTFTDLLDNEILSSKLAINDPVPSGKTIEWDGGLQYNQFMESHQRFRSAELENIKLRFAPRKILYTDGSEKDYE